MNKPIHTICVCGAGTMGSGIAQVCATSGYNTILFDLNETVLEKAKTSVEKNGGRLSLTSDGASGSCFVIELPLLQKM